MLKGNPLDLFRSLWTNRNLVFRLARREIESRYRGSMLGLAWAILNPVLLLAVYTFIFSVVFESKWDMPIESKSNFALILFVGLIIFNIFAECISRAPTLMLSNSVYIKKVVFPLEILPVVVIVSALFNAMISFGVLLIFYLLILGLPSWLVILLPFTIMPILLMVLGFSWFLASLGVFIRDIQQMIGVFIMIMMFLSPLFYPLSALPATMQSIVSFSPIAMTIEESRSLLFAGQLPDLYKWTVSFSVSLIIAWLGYLWFMLTRKGFADVL